MGWKSIKDHYRIGHIVHVEGEDVIIGSGYVSKLLVVHPDGSVEWGKLGPSENADLDRYHAEMVADPEKLRELFAATDVFGISLPVYTYDGWAIEEKFCEEYGWPNMTHDGNVMFENTYSSDRDTVIRWAKRSAALYQRSCRERIAEKKAELQKWIEMKADADEDAKVLAEEHPDVVLEKEDE